MRAYQAKYSIKRMAKALGVSASGYYAWRDRPPSARQRNDNELLAHIIKFHDRSDQTYGAPRIRADLEKELCMSVSTKRVARLMRLSGLVGETRRRGPKTTQSTKPNAEDLVKRSFAADKPNRLWVADITYVPTLEGFFYLAVVLDVFSRRIVGWAMRDHLKTELVLSALDMAIERRNPDGVVHHSDRGCQYTSVAFGERCAENSIKPSMGRTGTCYDNAMAESFFATLECELIKRNSFKTKTTGKQKVFTFIEGWYNRKRRHSSIDYLSPVDYEKEYRQKEDEYLSLKPSTRTG